MNWPIIIGVSAFLFALLMAFIAAFSIKAASSIDRGDTASAHSSATIIAVVSFLLCVVFILVIVGVIYFQFSPQGRAATVSSSLSSMLSRR